MKHRLLIIMALFFGTLTAVAQKTPVLLIVDMQKLYQDYWKAAEARDKLQSSVETAQAQIEEMLEDRNNLQEALTTLNEQLQSDAIAEAAREELTSQAQERLEELRQKNMDIQQFRQRSQTTLQQRQQGIVQLHFNEIREVVEDIAVSKGADLVLNSAGVAIIYADDSYDITQEVLDQLNASQDAE